MEGLITLYSELRERQTRLSSRDETGFLSNIVFILRDAFAAKSFQTTTQLQLSLY